VPYLSAITLGWIAGLVLGPVDGFAPAWQLAAGALGVLCLQLRPLWLSLPALGLSAAVLASGGIAPPAPGPTPRGGLARVSLEVVRTACGTSSCWAEANLRRCIEVDPDSCVAKGSRIALRSEQELGVGAHLTVLARVRPVVPFRNPKPAWSWPWRGVDATLAIAEGVPVKVDRAAYLGSWLVAARKTVRDAFVATLHAPHDGIARALLLGEGNAVDADLNDAIRASGVSHILAVSGMHVTVLAGAFVMAFQALWLRSRLALWFEARRAGAALGVFLSPLVAAFAGGAPSAWRAAFMSTLSYGLVALGRRPDVLAVCGASALLGMWSDAHDALHPGFVLSVLATSALLTLSKGEGGTLQTLRESTRTWLATAPFLSVAFGTVQVVSIAANVLLAPVGTMLIPLVAAMAASALWLPSLGGVAASAFETASGAFVVASKLASDLDPRWIVPSPTPVQAILLCAAAGLWLMATSLKTRLIGSAALMLGLGAEELRLRHPLGAHEARVTFLDVGQGDCTLVETGTGRHALVDAGGAINGGPDPGARSVLPLLRALRISRLEVVVLSHPHPDHYGGLEAVLSAVEVGELWDTGQACVESAQGFACKLLEGARRRGVRVLGPRELCGRPRALGPLQLRVVAPCPVFDEGFGENDNSFVLRVEHQKRSILLTGDVEHAAEAELVQEGAPLKADVLKVAHHGSRTSSTLPFLDAVQPWLAVISSGRGNRFGHPHAEVVDRLKSKARYVLGVDRVGGVRIRSDGKTLEVDAYEPGVRIVKR